MLIDATHAEETRVVVVDGNKVEEFDFESENKRQLAGNIYLAKVTRVEPSLQAAFVDYGGNRHGFLAFSEIHPDYYQIPVADREALMEEERADAEAQKAREEEEDKPKSKSRSRSRSRSSAKKVSSKDAVETREVETATDAPADGPDASPGTESNEISGMETIDLDREAGTPEGTSPIDLVDEPPVPTPLSDDQVSDDQGAETDTANDAAQDVSASAEGESAAASADAAVSDEADEAPAEEDATDPTDGQDADDDAADDEDGATRRAAREDDDSIESVSEHDDQEEIRPVRKPRPRRYKIQEVIKVRQIMLVQVVKEERGNKGAALTTYLSLAGRYCVLMPNTARGGGISRKITNAADRKKLKEIATEIDVPSGAGLIIRTAGANRTKAEIKRDYEYLQRLWEQIRELTLQSIAPAKIYEEGDLIKRSIRDLYNREIDEVLVEGERGYRNAKDFMKMIMPSHAKNVKNYHDSLPLFARYQVESYLSSMFNPTVQLKSGGYIVIGVTEALVAIDVNSGRATKEGSIEETALKTNLEAAEEVARQLRLRDLAGLIVIDFIDMDERKNNTAVEKKLKDKLKTDRARIQVGRISGFGLLEMSRQRLRPGMIEATTQPCPHCHGTGLIRSDDNLSLSILRQIEEEGVRRRSREVLVKCPVAIANYLMNQKREHVAQIEARYGLSVRIEGDPMLVSPDFALEKFKTATRTVPEPSDAFVSVDSSSAMAEPDEVTDPEEAPAADAQPSTSEEDDGKPKKKRRRRRRKKSGSSNNGASGQGDDTGSNGSDGDGQQADSTGADTAADENTADTASAEAAQGAPEAVDPAEGAAAPETAPDETAKPKSGASRSRSGSGSRSRSSGSRSKSSATSTRSKGSKAKEETAGDPAASAPETEAHATEDQTPADPASETAEKVVALEPVTAEAETTVAQPEPVAETQPEPVAAKQPEPADAAADAPAPEPKAEEAPKPKKRGWWSLGR